MLGKIAQLFGIIHSLPQPSNENAMDKSLLMSNGENVSVFAKATELSQPSK